MSKIMVIGDPHLKTSNIKSVEVFFGWILDIVRIQKPDSIVYLGDMFHTHNIVRSEIMTLVTKHIKELTKSVPCYILLGNHDLAHPKTPDIHAWIPFMQGYDNLYIIDKLIFVDGNCYLPYIDSQDEFQIELDKAMSSSDLIFCHQTFRDANFGFITTKEGAIVPTDYKGLIVAGHIHKTQKLGPVWYPGTPFAQEASDNGEIKGINLLDTETRRVTFIESPLPQWITTKTALGAFEAEVLKMNKNNKNHLVLSGPGPELTALMDTQRFRELKKEYGFSVKKEPSTAEGVVKQIRNISTLEGSITQYIDSIYDGDVDREVLKARCLEALI